MQGVHLLLAAVVAIQRPALPPEIGLALAQAQAAFTAVAPAVDALDGLDALDQLDALDGLDALDALDALDGGDPTVVQDDQDPTDSLWQAARRAFNRGDYSSAASLYADLTRRNPNSARAGDALYWAAFALYKNADLNRARSLLVEQQRRYPKAATLRDGDALLARIQTALAKQGDEEAGRWLAEHAQPSPDSERTRARGCPDEGDDDDLRIAALNGLLQMDAANAVPILKRVLARRDACSAGMRRKAVFLLSQKRTGETEDILLDVAQHDPDSEVRQQAVFWLSQVPTERAVGMLDSILKTTSDEELQDKAIFALSQQRNPRAGEILRAYADRPGAPAKARLKAIFWLGQRPSPENAAFLRALYSKLAEPDLKEKVIFSLSQMHGEENLRWMMDIALNEREDIEMRKKALFWAGQSGANLDQLVALYDRLQNQEMKEQLVFVYSQRREPAALDKLIDIARREPNRELRKKALFWIGQSHDPRAAKVLEEIINQ